ncbi:MAG: hypothetical protein FJ276_11480, partial [Planctomycetes bacterium]|nr:hypothetical protein [Planctomycetota bacterium]
MLLGATVLSRTMFIVGVVLLVTILLRRTYKFFGMRAATRQRPRPYLKKTPRPASDAHGLTDTPVEVLRWQVEMHDLGRNLKAELDTKMRVLQILIAQAKQEAERLEQLLDAERPPAPDSPRSQPADDDGPTGSAGNASEETGRTTRRLPATARRRAEIHALADQGHTAAAIAEAVGTPIGEV